MLRPQDEQLHRRLRDRLLMAAALPSLKGGPLEAADRVGHAAGLPDELERAGLLEPFVDAWRTAAPGAFDAAWRSLEASELPPIVLHHLALLHGRFSRTVGGLDAATAHDRLALVLWLRLWRERTYLSGLLETVCGSREIAEELLRELPRVLLAPIAEALARGRKDAAPSARQAMALLRAATACAVDAGLTSDAVGEVADVTRGLIEAVAREVVEEARLVAEQVDPVRARAEELAAPFRHVLGFASWAGLDEETMVFLLAQAHEYGWELYRVRRMEELRALLLPLRPCADELLARVVREPRMMGYRALCAQYFTFLGETESTLVASIGHLETAVSVCPTHRNARLILADFLLLDAARRLAAVPSAGIFGGTHMRAAALADLRASVARAIELWPAAKVPPELAAALEDS